MDRFKDLFEYNRKWAAARTAEDPHFFENLCTIQDPEFLWIGCSDSRVPANQITGLQPGEVFVHRNIANVVPREDVNSASVIQYAVEELNVSHIIVCGHYGCGGVAAAMGEHLHDPLEFWIEHLRRIRDKHSEELDRLPSVDSQWRRLCELNVITQTENVGRLRVVQNVWEKGEQLAVHGWIYDLSDGLLKELGVTIEGPPTTEL